jgi:hypothetical protein
VVGLVQPRLRYRPHGEQLSAFGQSRQFMNIIRGPLASGKTKAAVFNIIKLASEQRPDENRVRKTRIAAVRNTYPDLNGTTIPEFREVLHPLMGQVVNGHPPTCKMNFALPDGTTVDSEILFMALDRDDDIRKFRGMQITFIWFNELRFIPVSVVREGLSRCDRFPTPGFSPFVGGLADTNAWDEDHWLEEYAQRAALNDLEGWAFFNQPPAVIRATEGDEGVHRSINGTWWKVSPDAENLSVLGNQYYGRQIAGAKDDWIRVNLGNETGLSMDGKPVHPDYQESTHKATKELVPLPGIVIQVGMDFGLSPAAAFMQRQPNGRWHAFDEIVCEDMGAEKFANEIKLKVAEWRQRVGMDLHFAFRGDPSGDSRVGTDEGTVFKTLAAHGIVAVPASTNDVGVRRAALERPLTRMVAGGPGILFSPRCKTLRKGLKGGFQYKRVQVRGERYQDKPDKGPYSHICEAAEYALMDAGEHTIVNTSRVQQHTMPVVPKGAITI